MISPHAQALNPAGAAAIPTMTSSTPPPAPTPPGASNQTAKEEAGPRNGSSEAQGRRRGVVLIPESDVARLVRLAPGQHIAGLRHDHLRQAFQVLIAGDGLPLVDEMCDPPLVEKHRWAAPPPRPVHLAAFAETLNAQQTHAVVLLQLRTALDLDPPPGTAWAALEAIVRRHGPYEPRDFPGVQACRECPRIPVAASAGLTRPTYWPCDDYADAAGVVVIGLEAAGPGDE